MAKEKIKAKRSSAERAVNAVIAVVLVAMIALASFALYGKFRPRDKVKDMAEQMGMTVEDFKTEYGLEDVSPNAKFMDVYNDMTLENALKVDGLTFEDAMEQGLLPEGATSDMKVSDLQKIYEEMAAEEVPAEGEETPTEGETPAE